MLRRLDR